MPIIPAVPPVAPSAGAVADWNRLPDTAKPIVLQHLGASELSTLLGSSDWHDALSPPAFDRVARSLIERYERASPGRWPPLADWQFLAEMAGEQKKKGYVHAALLSNLWTSSARLASSSISEAQVLHDCTLGVELAIEVDCVIRPSSTLPEVIVTRWPLFGPAGDGGVLFLSRDGAINEPESLRGQQVMENHWPGQCAVVNSMLSGNDDAPLIVRNRGTRHLSLYDLSNGALHALPDVFSRSYYAAASVNGRFVAGIDDREDYCRLHVHDRETGTTNETRFSDRSLGFWRVSIDSEGGVVLAGTRQGIQLPLGADAREARSVELASDFGNFGLSPNERYVIANDATNTNIRLEDRNGEEGCITLLHPGATLRTGDVEDLILSATFSPGMTWVATTCTDGTLCIHSLVGAGLATSIEPALQIRLQELPPQDRPLKTAEAWFDPDGGGINVVYSTHAREQNAHVMRLRFL